MQKTNNEKVLRHYVGPLGPHELCHDTNYDIHSLPQHERLRQLPDTNNMEYFRGTLQSFEATREESSQRRDEFSCPVRTTSHCNYRGPETRRCNTCSHSKLIGSELNCCKLLSHFNCVYDGVRCVFNVTDTTRFSKRTDNCVNECNGAVVCDALDCGPEVRCCGVADMGHCPQARVGDGDSARVKAAGGLGKELSMLTVLLALVAIARSKCVLLPTPSARHWISLVVMWCLLFGCLFTPITAQTNVARQERVCQSVDIRNSVQQFEYLRGCTVVEGFVQILLIDRANESSYDNISFPELREITGYLLLYRATGLRSVGKIFPNLAVIRGHTLFYNYALVVYEMVNLQEIGLRSLTDIVRGGVRFEKNPLLCYVDTIDWDLIAKEAKGDLHFITGNRRQNECPMCPASESGEGPCPKSPITNQPLCWNRHHCQKVCPKDKCSSACNHSGSCCHDNCLGSCFRPNSQDDCFVCKDVSFKGKCIRKCPPDTYEYMERRCVDEAECYSMPQPKDPNQDTCQNKTWKPYKGTWKCLLDCPPNTEEKISPSGKLQCMPCQGSCRVECPGENVDSIASAQRLRGCTYIKGSLEIQITGGKNIVKELEDNLNMIEEIEGFLKVVRSFPLISLNFLKSLRVIHGKHLESDKYSLVVLDNQNLQELWGPEQLKHLKISRGRIFFHFNPKLCISVIQQMSRAVGIQEPLTDHEVAVKSNGDKVACNVTYLNVTVQFITSRHVLIGWEKFDHHDNRSLLGYVIYFTEAANRNLSLYDGRDACGSDGWRVDDVGMNDTHHLLTFLKPYTQYAFYVKTYTIAYEENGAQSPILYFMTSPDTPSPPLSVKVYSNSSTELVIKWRPPAQPNGNVTHYVITGYRASDEQTFLDPRNYCHEPITQEKKPVIPITDEEEEEKPKDSCSCQENKEKKQLEEDDIIFANHFEDTLQNQVYVKQTQHKCPSKFDPNSRKRRSVSSSFTMDNVLTHSSESMLSTPSMNQQPDINRTVYGTTVVLNDLHHFTQYLIWIVACRDATEVERKTEKKVRVCSKPAMVTDRTLPLDGADDIRFIPASLKTTNDSRGSNEKVEIFWQEPQQPNGVIVTYQIEYRRVDSENFKPTVECITGDQYKKMGSYVLTGLNPGNYSLQLRATSLAGYGAYTTVTYFQIQEETSLHTELIIGVTLVGVIALIICIGMLWYVRRKYKGVPNMKLIASVNPEYMSTVYVPDEWEVPRNKVELLRELGQGSFGMVYEGIATDVVEGQPKKRCAIKTVNEHATDRERSEFLNEASVMKAFNTHHVVKLLGVVSQGQPVLVIMELMTNGDLKTYLRSHRPDSNDDPSIQPPTLKRILQMAIEITDGMAYLAAKKFVHRDLAARNCMVADDLTVKIGDFGMTRDIYETDYYRKGTKGLLPVRWMAPESLKDGVFTSRSDVWSYGVVLWEMATLASQPYQGLSNDQVLRYVIDGGVMERPENCPDRLYELMRLCWQHKPASRPSFLDLVSILLADVPADFQQVSFYHSAEGCELRAHMAESEQLEDDPATPLRARDLEDFTLGGSDDDEEEAFGVPNHSPSNNFPRFISTRPTMSSTNLHGDQVVIALPTNGNKLGNGSAVSSPTTPTTANGWIPNRQNGTDTAHSSNSALRTTQC